ncbi:MAG: DUF535 family protein [Pseudomonadota bacterium]
MIKRFLAAGPVTLAQVFALSIRNFGSIRRVYSADRESHLGRLSRQRPELFGMVLTPFVSALWTASRRFDAIIDHCNYVEKTGWPLDVADHDYRRLVELPSISPGLHIELATPRWLTREGLLSLALVEGETLVFSLSFTFGHIDGQLVAYVGGLQGGADEKAPSTNRRLTRLSNGMRPRDLLIETFRILCRYYGVAHIYAITDKARVHRSAYLRAREVDPVVMSYDSVWRDRRGKPVEGGFFELPVAPQRRNYEAIRPNKRAEYRRRYGMLDAIEKQIVATLRKREESRPDEAADAN